MNQRIQKKQHKQYLVNLAKKTGVNIVTNRAIKRKQLINTQVMNQSFDQWLKNNRPKR